MVSTCLENLEALNKKGVDMETIYNTAFIVYIGMSRLVIVFRALPFPAADHFRSLALCARERSSKTQT